MVRLEIRHKIPCEADVTLAFTFRHVPHHKTGFVVLSWFVISPKGLWFILQAYFRTEV
jgi:hypothetical protein